MPSLVLNEADTCGQHERFAIGTRARTTTVSRALLEGAEAEFY